MTCHCCQTWNGDDEHRCSRCGRRLRSTPTRAAAQTHPIAATATARAYDFDEHIDSSAQMLAANQQGTPITQSDKKLDHSYRDHSETVQPSLFDQASSNQASSNQASSNQASLKPDGRLIPFTSLASPASLQSIRARAAELVRPGPVQNGKVEVSPRQGRTEQSRNGASPTGTSNQSRAHTGQQRLDFFGNPEILNQPQSNIICDASVAPPLVRAQAALIDTLLIALGWLAASSIFVAARRLIETPTLHSPMALAKYDVFVFMAIAVLIAFLYHLLWSFANRDSIGMQSTGLRLVDFDGNSPSLGKRYVRLFGTLLSCAAAGVGIVWAFVDQDNLTWHDHMSSTLPTFTPE